MPAEKEGEEEGALAGEGLETGGDEKDWEAGGGGCCC